MGVLYSGAGVEDGGVVEACDRAFEWSYLGEVRRKKDNVWFFAAM